MGFQPTSPDEEVGYKDEREPPECCNKEMTLMEDGVYFCIKCCEEIEFDEWQNPHEPNI